MLEGIGSELGACYRQKDRLALTGCVWEACEAIEKLSLNSVEVACKIVQREEGLVVDALQEIEDVRMHTCYMTRVRS